MNIHWKRNSYFRKSVQFSCTMPMSIDLIDFVSCFNPLIILNSYTAASLRTCFRRKSWAAGWPSVVLPRRCLLLWYSRRTAAVWCRRSWVRTTATTSEKSTETKWSRRWVQGTRHHRCLHLRPFLSKNCFFTVAFDGRCYWSSFMLISVVNIA